MPDGTLHLARGPGRSARRASSDLDAWLKSALTEIGPPPRAEDGWTPKAVGEALIDALRWARHAAGRTGPAGMVSAHMPEAILSMEDRLALGWDAAVTLDPDDQRPVILRPSSQQVSRHLAALEWPADYLLPDHPGSARTLGLWAACKAYRRPFDRAVRERGIHRSMAYQLRDRGLSLIAQGLDRDGVPLC